MPFASVRLSGSPFVPYSVVTVPQSASLVEVVKPLALYSYEVSPPSASTVFSSLPALE